MPVRRRLASSVRSEASCNWSAASLSNLAKSGSVLDRGIDPKAVGFDMAAARDALATTGLRRWSESPLMPGPRYMGRLRADDDVAPPKPGCDAGARGARNEYALDDVLNLLVPGWKSVVVLCEDGRAGGATLLAREDGAKPLVCLGAKCRT